MTHYLTIPVLNTEPDGHEILGRLGGVSLGYPHEKGVSATFLVVLDDDKIVALPTGAAVIEEVIGDLYRLARFKSIGGIWSVSFVEPETESGVIVQ